jgi:hypothetical protein
VFPQTTFWGVPTGRTFAAVGRAIGLVRQQARVQVSPTPTLPPLFLAAVTAMWAAAFSAHALLVRAGSPILAMLPPVALVGFADTVLDDGGRPFFAVLFLLGVLAMFLADSVRRLRLWGPVWQWEGRSGRSRSIPFRGATRVAVIAIGAAALLPGLLPGFGAGPLVDLSSGAGETHIDPFVSIQTTLLRAEKTPQTLFTVESPIQSYWRMLSLDHFDAENSSWETSDPKVMDGSPIAPGALALPGEAAGSLPGMPTQSVGLVPPVTQTITVESTDAGGRDVAADGLRATGGVVPVIDPLRPRARDRVRAARRGGRNALPGDLRRPRSRRAKTSNGFHRLGVDLASPGALRLAPPGLPPYLARLAHQIVDEAEATTPFDQALAIQSYLRRPPFVYNLHADYSHDPNSILDFLTKTHAGMCQQFAGSMALLVRELGPPGARRRRLPARARPRSRAPRHLHGDDRRAPRLGGGPPPGYGWIAFEPTKGISNPVADASYLSASTACTARGCAGAGSSHGGPRRERAKGSGATSESTTWVRSTRPEAPCRCRPPSRREGCHSGCSSASRCCSG